MNIERDIYLARVMGYTYVAPSRLAQAPDNKGLTNIPNYSTWEGFGALFEWVQKQEWDYTFYTYAVKQATKDLIKGRWWESHLYFINPDRFANYLYSYLKNN